MSRIRLIPLAVVAIVLSALAMGPATAGAKPQRITCGDAVKTAEIALNSVTLSGGKLIKHLTVLREINREITELRALQDAAPTEEGKAQIQVLLDAAYVRHEARLEKVRFWQHEWSLDVKTWPRRVSIATKVVALGGCSAKQRNQFAKVSGQFWDRVAEVGRKIANLD